MRCPIARVSAKFSQCEACFNRDLPDVCVGCWSGELFQPEYSSDSLDLGAHDEVIRLEDL